ncbi:MAG: alpha/beta fold hydrolase, partial [Planctomycetota bacterium]
MRRLFARGRLRWVAVASWCVATAASQLVVQTRAAKREAALARHTLQLPAKDGAARPVRLAFLRWTPEDPDSGLAAPPSPDSDAARRPTVLMLHGSPGSAGNFRRVAPLLARAGWEVVALDLPGFGASEATGRYSIEANGRVALRAMDALHLQRAHVVGFSLGGGAALWMAKLAPQRLASLTLLSSIGVQEAEGSGSYAFEHFKYALGFPFVVALPELTPHFGVLGSSAARWAFLRSFWDTDQRPLRGIMTSLTLPTLIVHGGSDPLVPAWAARLHHRLISTSSLVMLDASHFFVFLKPALTAVVLTPFFARHDRPGQPPLRFVADFAPASGGEAELGPFHINHGAPWWVVVALIILATFISEDITVITVGLLVARGQIDWSVGLIGCYLGIVLGDASLWAIGRFVGRPALKWPLLRRILPEKALDRWGRWFDRHSVAAVFLTRAIPGTRLPTYLAAGMLSRRA